MNTLLRSTLLAALLAALPAAGQEPAPRQLTLDDALALAGKKNLDLKVSQADADVARTDVVAAQSGFLPRLDLSATGGHSWIGEQHGFDSRIGAYVTPGSDEDSYTAGAQLSLPLFSGFRTVNSVKSARASERAASLAYDETRLAVAFQVTQRFYELLKAARSLAVLEENARRSEELVARADALYAAGKMSKSDTIQARVNLGNDQISVQNQRVTVQLRRSALATALGLPADEQLQAVAPPELDAATLPQGEPPTLDALVATAKQHRPLLASDAATVEAARASVGTAKADYWPELSAQANYDRYATRFGGANGVYSGNLDRQYSADAQLVLSWNLFEGRATQARVERAQVTARRAGANAERNAVVVAQEIADARAGVVWLTQAVGLAAQNLEVAQQGVALATQRLEAGLLSQLEARDASLKLTQAQLALVQARIDHAIAVADLNRAVGGAL